MFISEKIKSHIKIDMSKIYVTCLEFMWHVCITSPRITSYITNWHKCEWNVRDMLEIHITRQRFKMRYKSLVRDLQNILEIDLTCLRFTWYICLRFVKFVRNWHNINEVELTWMKFTRYEWNWRDMNEIYVICFKFTKCRMVGLPWGQFYINVELIRL